MITTNDMTVEELKKHRDEWDARNAEQKAKHDEQYAKYQFKEKGILNGIKGEVEDALCDLDLDLEVDVTTGFSFINPGAIVNVSSNQHRVHAEDKALSWNWKVARNTDGNIEKETGSWSGLQATTAEQMGSLRETVKALEILNSLDWESLLDIELPKYGDYITEKASIGERPRFEEQIKLAEISGFVGQNTLVELHIDKWRREWVLIVGETAKQFKIHSFCAYEVEPAYLEQRGTTLAELVEKRKQHTTRNITKDKFLSMINNPVKTLDF